MVTLFNIVPGETVRVGDPVFRDSLRISPRSEFGSFVGTAYRLENDGRQAWVRREDYAFPSDATEYTTFAGRAVIGAPVSTPEPRRAIAINSPRRRIEP